MDGVERDEPRLEPVRVRVVVHPILAPERESDLNVVDVAGAVGPHGADARLVVAVGVARRAAARRDAREVPVLL
eukprot:1830882-Rhodomonas_salina.1